MGQLLQSTQYLAGFVALHRQSHFHLALYCPPNPSDFYTQATNLNKNYLQWRVLFRRENDEVGTHQELLQKKSFSSVNHSKTVFPIWVFLLFKWIWALRHVSPRLVMQPVFFKPYFQPFSSVIFILPLPWAV